MSQKTPARPMFRPFLEGKRVLVIGGNGRVGKLLCPQLEAAEPEVLIVTSRRGEEGHFRCTLPDDIDKLPAPSEVDVVLNLAAVSTPRSASDDPALALNSNISAVHALIEKYQNRCVLVLVSSVRSVGLSSLYSWTKLASEALGTAGKGRIRVIRIGNILAEAGVVAALKESLPISQQGQWVSGGYEYFQSSFSLAVSIRMCMEEDWETPVIITPLLNPVPVSFLAGCLAGWWVRAGAPDLRQWNPVYKYEAGQLGLVPDWWIEHSAYWSVADPGFERHFGFIVTDFRGDTGVDEHRLIREKLHEESFPRLGKFVQALLEEGLLER